MLGSRWLKGLRPSASSKRPAWRGPLLVEVLETRLAPAVAAVGPAVRFDGSTGLLSIVGADGTSARVEGLDNGTVAVILDGQLQSSGATAATLTAIDLAGGPADSLTLGNLATPGDLALHSDGAITVTGSVRAGSLVVSTTGLLNVEPTGSLIARTGDNGGTITAAADSFVNVGQVRADGAHGGRVSVTARYDLNAGTVSAAGAAGPGGQVQVAFTESYIDTATATTAATGAGGAGGAVSVNGGSAGRLFSSGHFTATGTAGGSVDLFGHDVLLVGAAADASGAAGAGGRLRVGGDSPGGDPVPDAQTVFVSPTTSLRADGTGAGGRVVVWSEAGTAFGGDVSARGAGSIEVSSHGTLTYGGTAEAGKGGTLLLDPKFIVVSAGTGATFPQFNLVNPGAGGAFGTTILTLPTGNIVVTDPKVNASAGAVYLFDGLSGKLLSTLTGGGSNNQAGSGGVTALTNGNFVVSSPKWTGSEGAATWGSGTAGVSGAISAANSLVGSTGTGTGNGDQVSSGGVTALTNGNYVVDSPAWSNTFSSTAKGAVTWGSGTTGVQGVLAAANSLVGGSAADRVGSGGVTALANGNFVVGSPFWASNKGAATWASGTAGIAGNISASNSLVGSNTGSSGDFVSLGGVTALPGGNYVVTSASWNGSEGAATWGNGASGVVGVLASSNSLVGTTSGSSADAVGSGGVTVLSNGNYVVGSPQWNARRGAATWGSAATGVSGTVSASNSIVGPNTGLGSTGDHISSSGVFALTDGNFVVCSAAWGGFLGAVTWGNGTTGTSETVSAANSLVGSNGAGLGDQVGSGGVTALTNGNYVVSSPHWRGSTGGSGAATWGNGTTGITGAVSASNSLVGSNPTGDGISSGSITALTNGNYVVCSPGWDGAEGAATWGSGTAGVSGLVSTANSVVGGTSTDSVGGGGATALPGGYYVIKSPAWNNNAGAATFENGSGPVAATVSAANSLAGSSGGTSGDKVSSGGVVVLPNGNYVVLSPLWNLSKGAVTWGSGTAGVGGTLSLLNSLVGTTGGSTGDQVGSGGVTALADGNFVVSSPLWNGSAGAVTWLDGATGTTLDGQDNPDAGNSLLGAAAKAGLVPVQLGAVTGSFVAAFSTENGGRVTVGFVNAGGTNADQLPFSFQAAQTVTLDPSFLQHSLNAGTDVVLQANDDITVSSPVTAQPTGTPGNLTLQAGRSLLLNAGIKTAGGNLTLVANDSAADGVIDAQRDPGPANLTEASGITLDAGSGTLSVDLKATTDTTNHAQGAVTLLGAAGGSVTLSPASPLGVTINGSTPGDGRTAGQYTQASVTGPLSLNGAPLVVSHKVATTVGETFTIVHASGGVSGTFASLTEGSTVTAADGTLFSITYRANGGKDVMLTQLVSPTQLVVTTPPPVSVTAGRGFGLAVSVEDAQGNVATNYTGTVTVALASNPGGSTLGGTLTVPVSQGVATFSGLTLDKAGSGYTLQATGGSLTAATTSPFAVAAGTANHLALTAPPPATVTAGAAISPAVTVAVEDAFGNVVTTDTSTVTAALASGPGSLGGTTTATASAGVATFDDLVLQTAGSYTLKWTDGALGGTTSSSFTVGAAAADHLAFAVPPGDTLAAAAIRPAVQVQVLDAFGNLLTGDDTDPVTVALGTNPDGGTLGGTTTVTVSGGVATFADLTVDRIGTGYALSASASGLPAVSSVAFNITTLIDHMAFAAQPGSATAGSALSPAVRVQLFDGAGNVLTGDNTDQVTLTVASGPGGFAAGSTTTVTVVGGVATFTNLVLDTSGSYTLAVTATGGVSGPASDPFTTSPAAANQLAFGSLLASTTAGVLLSPALTVQVLDRFGNLVTTDNSDHVTLGVNGPGGFAPGSTTTATVSGGVATFANVTLDTAGAAYALTAGASGLRSGTSAAFAVVPAAADHLAFVQAPAAAVAGQALNAGTSPAGVRVGVFDAFNNLLTGDNTDQVTLSIQSGPGSTLLGTLTRTVSGGIGVFGDLVLDTAGSYTLQAGSPTLTALPAATSAGFTINPAAAAQLAVVQQPSAAAVAGATFTTQPMVALEDAFGNVIASDSTHTVTAARGGHGTAPLQGASLTVTLSGGVATFAGLAYDRAETMNLAFSTSAGSFTVTSADVAVAPAAASRLVLGQQPASSTAGTALSPAVTVQVQDRFGNLVTSDNSTVTLTLSSGTFEGGSATAGAAASGGVATFGGLKVDTAGSYTLAASDGSLTAVTSNGFTISPAAASQLIVTRQPSAAAVAGVAFATQPVVAEEDAFGNVLTADSTHTVTAATGDHGTAALQGTSLTVTLSGGVATFAGLAYDKAEAVDLAFSTDAGAFTATSADVTVAPAAAARLVYGQQPVSAAAGAALSPAVTVQVQDRFGNVVTADTSTVTLTLGGGTFEGGSATAGAAASGGVATFAGLKVDTAGSYNMAAGDGSLTAAISANFTISPATADHLAFGQQPGSTAAGTALKPAVTVRVLDRFGNLLTGDNTDQVTLGVAGPGGFTPGSTTAVTVSGGVAAFTNLTLDTAGAGYTLTASAPGLSGATSAAFAVTPGAADHLAFVQAPAAGTAGQLVNGGTGGVRVGLLDAFNNLLTGDNTDVIALALVGGPASLLSGALVQGVRGGVADFADLSVGAAGSYVLQATSPALPGQAPVGSPGFTIGPATSVPLPAARGIFAQLVTTKVGKKKKLVVKVFFADSGALKTQLTSPFQKPAFKAIAVSVKDGNGDGVPDEVVLTAKKGKHTVSQTFPG